MNKAVIVAVLACAAGAVEAGTLTVRYVPFQSGAGGEFRVEKGAGFHGKIDLASDIDGVILTTGGTNGAGNNNADNGKVLAPSGNFWQEFSRADGNATQQAARRAASNANRAVKDFQTFCMEQGENVSNNTTYTFSIDTAAVAGGRGNGPLAAGNPDPLGDEAAWLYTQFRYNTLSGYNMWGDSLTELQRERSARTLQHALWYFENELGTATTGLNLDTSTAAATMANVFPASNGNPNNLDATEQAQALAWVQAALNAVAGGWTNTNVRILNLFVDNNMNGVYDAGIDTLAQSMLTLIPLPTPITMAGTGLLAIAGVSRRRIGH